MFVLLQITNLHYLPLLCKMLVSTEVTVLVCVVLFQPNLGKTISLQYPSCYELCLSQQFYLNLHGSLDVLFETTNLGYLCSQDVHVVLLYRGAQGLFRLW